MKKLLTITALLLTFVFALSFMGCNKTPDEDAIFEGSYKQAEAEKVQELKTEIIGQPYAQDLNFKIKFDMDISVQGSSQKMNGCMIFNATTPQDAVMSGNMDIEVNAQGVNVSTSANYYYANGFMYINGGGQKLKEPVDFDDAIENITGYEVDSNLIEILNSSNLKYDEDGDLIKLKADLVEDGLNLNVTMVLNKQTKKIVAQKILMSGTSYGETLNIEMSYLPTTETVELPTDLNTYVYQGSSF